MAETIFYKLRVEVCDGTPESAAMFECSGRYLGHLIAYAFLAVEPYIPGTDVDEVLADTVESLPKDHPAHKFVKLTNRAVAGDV